MGEFDKLIKLTYAAWQLQGKPQEKTGLIKRIFTSNAGFLDRINKIMK